MKKRLLIPFVATAIVFSSCSDSLESLVGISKPQLRKSDPVAKEIEITVTETEVETEEADQASTSKKCGPNCKGNCKASSDFRISGEMILTDAMGRSIQVKLLAKKGNEISIEKLPAKQQFVLPLEKLSKADQVALLKIPDGGAFGAIEAVANTIAISTDRKAIWHSHISNAEKEATRLGIPLLVTVLNADDRSSEELEKNLVYSRVFKKWADKNVTLCLLRTGSGSRDSTFQTWQTLAKYGIAQSESSSMALINPKSFTGKKLTSRSSATIDQILGEVDEVVRKQSSWASISAAQAPTRQASPFKVSSRARSSGG